MAEGLKTYKLVGTVLGVIVAMVIAGIYDLDLLGTALLLTVNAWVFFGIVRANWLRVLGVVVLLISTGLFVSQMHVAEMVIRPPVLLACLSAVFLIANIGIYFESFRKRKRKEETR